jgi:hypothetical protein
LFTSHGDRPVRFIIADLFCLALIRRRPPPKFAICCIKAADLKAVTLRVRRSFWWILPEWCDGRTSLKTSACVPEPMKCWQQPEA